MVCQHTLLFERLEVVEAMGTFISHRMSSSEELCANLERVESDLAVTHKAAVEGAEALKLEDGKKEVTCVEENKLREEGRTIEAKCKEAEHENAQLKKEMKKLRFEFTA